MTELGGYRIIEDSRRVGVNEASVVLGSNSSVIDSIGCMTISALDQSKYTGGEY